LTCSSSRALNQPDYWRLGGWSSSWVWVTLHPITEILNLSFLMLRKVLNPKQAKVSTRQPRLNRV
jgi:hypothetical protein